MVHVDLEVQKKVWYDIGLKGINWSDAQYAALKALDRYQREQVLEAHQKGVNDRIDLEVL